MRQQNLLKLKDATKKAPTELPAATEEQTFIKPTRPAHSSTFKRKSPPPSTNSNQQNAAALPTDFFDQPTQEMVAPASKKRKADSQGTLIASAPVDIPLDARTNSNVEQIDLAETEKELEKLIADGRKKMLEAQRVNENVIIRASVLKSEPANEVPKGFFDNKKEKTHDLGENTG